MGPSFGKFFGVCNPVNKIWLIYQSRFSPLSQLGGQKGMWSTRFELDLDILKLDHTSMWDFDPTEIAKEDSIR